MVFSFSIRDERRSTFPLQMALIERIIPLLILYFEFVHGSVRRVSLNQRSSRGLDIRRFDPMVFASRLTLAQ